MRIRARPIAILTTALMLAAACSRPPPGGETAAIEGFGSVPQVGSAAPTTSGPAATSDLVEPETSAAIERRAAQQASADLPGAVGIDGGTVKIVFHEKLVNCGDRADESSGSTANEGGLKVLEFYVRYFNEVILKPYGWKVAHQLVDDGGYACPEKGVAAARRIVNEIKPFAVIGQSATERGPVVADIVTAAGIRHIGVSYATSAELRKRRGLAWIFTPLVEQSYGYLASYIGKRIKSTPYRDPTTGVQAARRYGLAVADLPEYRTLAGVMKRMLTERGVNLEQIYFISPDIGVATQQALVTIQRMRQDGINSLIFDFSPQGYFSGIQLTHTMSSQNYLPDLLVGTYGLPVLDQLHNSRAWARAQGVSPSPTLALRSAVVEKDGRLDFDPRYAEISENGYPWKDVWYEEEGGTEIEGGDPAPTYIWNGLAIVALGLINHTGDRLTATSWAEGVWSSRLGGPNRCGVWRLVGREYEYSPLWDFEDAPDGGLENYTTIYWRNKQTLLTTGYWESFDNYRYFAGDGDLPPRITRDTGKQGDDIPHQKRIGIHPWVGCKTFGLTD